MSFAWTLLPLVRKLPKIRHSLTRQQQHHGTEGIDVLFFGAHTHSTQILHTLNEEKWREEVCTGIGLTLRNQRWRSDFLREDIPKPFHGEERFKLYAKWHSKRQRSLSSSSGVCPVRSNMCAETRGNLDVTEFVSHFFYLVLWARTATLVVVIYQSTEGLD